MLFLPCSSGRDNSNISTDPGAITQQIVETSQEILCVLIWGRELLLWHHLSLSQSLSSANSMVIYASRTTPVYL